MRTRRSRVFFRFALAAVFAAVGAASARAQVPSPVVGSSVTPRQRAPAEQRVWLPVFQFRSGFWVNLHHFLYLQARIQRGLAVVSRGQPAPPAWAAANLSGLSAEENRAWARAVGYYASHFADHDLPYDSFLVRIDNRLSAMDDCPDLNGRSRPACASGIDPRLTAILEEAAPVYRAHWWAEQKRENQAWISRASMLIREDGGKPAEMLALTFNNTWPTDPIPIDVTLYAGAYGAYTTLQPIHVTVSSIDPRNQGPLALEVVFRESSHAIAEPIAQAIVHQCHEQTKAIPRELWHALAFYTTARIFKRAFAGQPAPGASGLGSASFVASERAYAAARGWQNYEVLLDLYWQPYLDGRIDMDTAIDNLVGAL